MRFSNPDFSLRALALAAVVSSLALASACGGSGSSNNSGGGGGGGGNQVIAGPGPNVVTLTVDAGPTALVNSGNAYLNGSFVSVNVCVPGTSTCQTIDHLLVDTGSFGLRLLDTSSQGEFSSSQFPAITDTSSNPIAECVQFLDGSFFWGRVALADVKFASPTTEVASSVPVHIIGDTTFAATHPVGPGCTGTDADTLASLGANGIIGVGNVQYDCGSICAPGSPISPPPAPAYYTCPSGVACSSAYVPLAQQVQNPVALFATDNNGVIVELPSPPSAGSTGLTGALVFGIGTQSNNALGSASVLTVGSDITQSNYLDITTSYNGTSYPQSFIDSGSNAYFFLDPTTTSIPGCSDAPSFYCPSSTQNLSASNEGQNGTTTSISFSIANFDNLSSSNVAFNNVGGPNSGIFDWGLPFFMGRNVFVSIAGKTAPGGTPPYVAY
jgi:Protein of unknown function (DUF3443)